MKNLAFDINGQEQITSKTIATSCMVGTKNEFFAKQKLSEMQDGTHYCVELDFIRSVIKLWAGESPRKKAYKELEARIIKALFENCIYSDTTAIGFKNEKTIGVR